MSDANTLAIVLRDSQIAIEGFAKIRDSWIRQNQAAVLPAIQAINTLAMQGVGAHIAALSKMTQPLGIRLQSGAFSALVEAQRKMAKLVEIPDILKRAMANNLRSLQFARQHTLPQSMLVVAPPMRQSPIEPVLRQNRELAEDNVELRHARVTDEQRHQLELRALKEQLAMAKAELIEGNVLREWEPGDQGSPPSLN